ncbi:MAG TPA: glycosyl hydrolase family 65 protein, partial [Cytophagales bacterium]|nr:glycosyl hydrolase family 65 protein [Cytophagales bacterium]
NHGITAEDIATYKVEPYVMAADVYGVAPHTGRGGWTWYTGSAGWMYTLILESFLGFRREGDKIYFEPCVPDNWTNFSVNYRYHGTFYHIEVLMTPDQGGNEIIVDGHRQEQPYVQLHDDQKAHQVLLKYGKISISKQVLSSV